MLGKPDGKMLLGKKSIVYIKQTNHQNLRVKEFVINSCLNRLRPIMKYFHYEVFL